jgi:hypothetical protein
MKLLYSYCLNTRDVAVSKREKVLVIIEPGETHMKHIEQAMQDRE